MKFKVIDMKQRAFIGNEREIKERRRGFESGGGTFRYELLQLEDFGECCKVNLRDLDDRLW